MTARSGEENIVQGDFGEMWLRTVAAGCGISHGSPHSTDLEKTDVELTLREVVKGTYYPTVKAQVKTTSSLRESGDEHFVYDLDAQTYEVLRRVDHSIPRILVVIGLSEAGDRVRCHEEGVLLMGRAVWVSLEGKPATTNRRTKVVRLPAANAVDPQGLRKMLETFGVRRSTPVPDEDLWGEEET